LPVTRPGRPKNRREQWNSEERELAALVQELCIRVLNCSASGCLLESVKQVRAGTIATLQLSFGGQTFSDLVKVVRCDDVDRNGARYQVATEFLSATPASAAALRHVMRYKSSKPAEWLTGVVASSGTNVPRGADNQNGDARRQAERSSKDSEFRNVLTCPRGKASGRESGNELADLVTAAQPTATNKKR
jgi:hypothetical protein